MEDRSIIHDILCLLLTCFLWLFIFITLMFVYFQQLLHCFIIYSYKTNPSFLPCPCNSRSIWPSDFYWCFTLYRQYFSHTHRQNSTIIWPGATNEFDTVATCGEKQVGDSEDASLDRERSTIIWLKSDPLFTLSHMGIWQLPITDCVQVNAVWIL